MARNGDGFHRRRGLWGFRYKDDQGVYREKSTGKRKQPEAREYKHIFLEKLRRNQLPNEEAKWTLGQSLSKWIEYRSATRAKASVAAEQTAARHLSEILGSRPCARQHHRVRYSHVPDEAIANGRTKDREQRTARSCGHSEDCTPLGIAEGDI